MRSVGSVLIDEREQVEDELPVGHMYRMGFMVDVSQAALIYLYFHCCLLIAFYALIFSFFLAFIFVFTFLFIPDFGNK